MSSYPQSLQFCPACNAVALRAGELPLQDAPYEFLNGLYLAS